MRIVALQYTLQHKSLDIYLSGCIGNPHCEGCHNPELWSFDIGDIYDERYFMKIKNKVKDFDNLIDNIMIFGGEPLDQENNELRDLIFDLGILHKKIWIFTHYDIEVIPQFVKIGCDYIKTGRYIPELKCEDNIQYGIKLATSNQKIYKTEELHER